MSPTGSSGWINFRCNYRITFRCNSTPYCAEWLRNLIREGLIADGDVDERSIKDVESADLDGYTQCHFFAGIGGWSYALRLAGWPDDRPVWTGSCPCQPFSVAGAGRGHDDVRHLWPEWARLIRKLGPAIVFGEQTPTIRGLDWLDGVAVALEKEDYAVGSAVIPAYAVTPSNLRERLWFLANRLRKGLPQREADCGRLGKTNEGQARIDITRNADKTWHTPQAFAECCQADDGLPNRVGQIRAYGNAIVPQAAAAFIGAYMDAVAGPPE